MTKPFSHDDVPDMTGKVCIVTGANTGIGRACATVLAKKGAHVIFACRTAEKTEPVIAEIKASTGNTNVEFIALNLLSLSSVTSFIETFKARNLPLHLLLNNAGVMAPPFSLSADGIESQFATNHIGHFYLTTQLLPILEASAPSRIVQVSSDAHVFTFGGLNLQSLNDPKKYNGWTAYGRSKLANILFARELTKKLGAKGVKNIYVNSNNPGAVSSDLQRYATYVNILKYFVTFVNTDEGALTQMYLATSPEVEEKDIRGQYYVPIAKPGTPSKYALNDKLAEELWEWTENTLKEKVPGYPGSPI
ncbi:hypothetical protein BC937DRAFT_88179 [Endogone sp. FLAS-F59071]|nr:hypothetical protein BC937DRAFT_88179 [Endogone sp. FLAS-F59071]|eukprot:RUS18907.1 hypothetical protein BC937DRAFT_88179 [Endogone sp. FLAS-F59071]